MSHVLENHPCGVEDCMGSLVPYCDKHNPRITDLEAQLKEAYEWMVDTANELQCHCDEAYTKRGMHDPHCKAYLLRDCPLTKENNND